ncbi:MAG: thiol-disulfide oxidoreductase DCC family protein [Myxococcota bacterium]
MFFDGDCPLCAREVAFLRRRDRHARVEWVDIAAPGFDAAEYGLASVDLMARIHGQLPGAGSPEARLVEGMEVFRRAYAAVGLGWLLAPTAWPGLRRLADAAYRWFARNRLRLTGRERECGDHCAPRGASPP